MHSERHERELALMQVEADGMRGTASELSFHSGAFVLSIAGVAYTIINHASGASRTQHTHTRKKWENQTKK